MAIKVSLNQNDELKYILYTHYQKSKITLKIRDLHGSFMIATNTMLQEDQQDMNYFISRREQGNDTMLILLQNDMNFGKDVKIMIHGCEKSSFMKLTPIYQCYQVTKSVRKRVKRQETSDFLKEFKNQKQLRSTQIKEILKLRQQQQQEKLKKYGDKIKINRKNIAKRNLARKLKRNVSQKLKEILKKKDALSIKIQTRRKLELNCKLERIKFIRKRKKEYLGQKRIYFITGHWRTIFLEIKLLHFLKMRFLKYKIIQMLEQKTQKCFDFIFSRFRAYLHKKNVDDPIRYKQNMPFCKMSLVIWTKCLNIPIIKFRAEDLVVSFLSQLPFTLQITYKIIQYHKAVSFVKNRWRHMKEIHSQQSIDIEMEFDKIVNENKLLEGEIQLDYDRKKEELSLFKQAKLDEHNPKYIKYLVDKNKLLTSHNWGKKKIKVKNIVNIFLRNEDDSMPRQPQTLDRHQTFFPTALMDQSLKKRTSFKSQQVINKQKKKKKKSLKFQQRRLKHLKSQHLLASYLMKEPKLILAPTLEEARKILQNILKPIRE